MTQSPHGGDVAQLAKAAGCAPEDILDFSASINPLGPPEWLRPVISSAVSSLAHYPDPHCRELLAAASSRYGVPETRLVAGNGTSDLLFALARAMAGQGATHAVIPAPAYVDYRTACERAGLTAESLILSHEDGFRLDEAALLAMLRPGSAAFLGRPGNPTGRDVPADMVRRMAAARPDCLFVADEAFGSFVEGFESLVQDRPANVAVLLSLTKMFAIPGLRLGLLCASDELAGTGRAGTGLAGTGLAGTGLAGAVRAQLSPWSVNTLAQAVGLRAMADREFEARSRENAAALRRELSAGLAALPGLEVFPGAANYLLCRLEAGDVPALRARLLARRIAIRDCSNFEGLDARFFRVAVRALADNERLLEALEAELAPARRRVIRKRRTPALMIQGTTSNAGKSVLAAALCRILKQDGVRVAPFKSQNMSLNSCVTPWGEEMGRAQVLQAQACGLAPQARMNPVLLKPCSDTGSQVIVMGRPVGNMRVREYVAYKPTAFAAAKQAYDSLAGEFEAVILEGAGSPAEVNLKHHDMVNMAMAAHAGAKVLLAGDIDRGGVFAALCGTMELLTESERAMVGGYVLNRFRGDPSLLDPALEFMRATTGKRVLGVVPNIEPLGLPEEDSVSFKQGGFGSPGPRELDIAVLDLPHISNFTDLDALAREPDVSLRVVRSPGELGRPDALILPGSKNTLADLAHLRAAGLADAVARLIGVEIVGVCAGLQMLGARILDPLGLESDRGEEAGLGLLPLVTELMPEKTLLRTEALHAGSGHTLRGYEIHHGETVPDSMAATDGGAPALLTRVDGRPLGWGRMGGVWGTYLHGLFDADGFRGWWLDALRARKGLAPLERAVSGDGENAAVDAALNRLAAVVRRNLDMEAVHALLGL